MMVRPYPVTVRVTDNGSPAKNAETTFTVTVAELFPLIHAWNFNDTSSVATLLTPSTTVAGAPATMTASPEFLAHRRRMSPFRLRPTRSLWMESDFGRNWSEHRGSTIP